MGEGKVIDIKIDEDLVSVRDYGRGIPIGKVVDVVSKMNKTMIRICYRI